MEEEQRSRQELSMAESQLSVLQNMRVLFEEVSLLARNLAYHRRAKIEARLDLMLHEVERQMKAQGGFDDGCPVVWISKKSTLTESVSGYRNAPLKDAWLWRGQR